MCVALQEHLSKRKMLAGRSDVSLFGIGTIEWTNLPTRIAGAAHVMMGWYLDHVFSCMAKWHTDMHGAHVMMHGRKGKKNRQSDHALAEKMQHKSDFWCDKI